MTPSVDIRKSPDKLWDFVNADLREKISQNPDAANLILSMSDSERDEFKKKAYKSYSAKPEFSVIIGEVETPKTYDPYFGTVGGTVRYKTRPLQDREVERKWRGLNAGDVGLDSISEDERKGLLQIASDEESPILPYLKYDSRYLAKLREASEILEKDARRAQLDMDKDWRGTWFGELARGVGAPFVNLASGVSAGINRMRGGVEYGNPENLSESEITDRAFNDAFAVYLPYLAGTADFEDIRREASLGRKLSRGAGDILSFIISTPNQVLMEGGMKAAAKLGVENTIAKMAAGGAAVGAANVLTKIPTPDREYGVGDFARDSAMGAAGDAAAGALFGLFLKGVFNASQQALSRFNPIYKEIFNLKPEDSARALYGIKSKIESGRATEDDKFFYNTMLDIAKSNNLDLDKILEGRMGIGFNYGKLRDWVNKTPVLRSVAPQQRLVLNPREVNVDVGRTRLNSAFDADGFRAQADEALKRRYEYDWQNRGFALQEYAPPALAPQLNPRTYTRFELARDRLLNNPVSRGRYPIYSEGPVQEVQAALFSEEQLPSSNDVLNRKFFPVFEVPVSEIKLSKDVPNFKEGADEETGVVEGQQLRGKYERKGTAPIVVWERLNGDLEVITGRHRLNLAKTSGELSIPAQIVKESEGFSVEDAKTFDAESNIRDGNGTVRDYAHFFRNKEISEPEAIERGLIAREKGRKGWDIGRNSSDALYDLYRNGKISEDKAAAIAQNAPKNPDVQKAALAKRTQMTAPELAIFTRNLDLRYRFDGSSALASGQAGQLDLFDSNSPWIQEMEKISRVQAKMIRENIDKITAVKNAVKRPEAAKKMGVDINNPEAVKAEIERLQIENARIANPDGKMLQEIRARAGLDPVENRAAPVSRAGSKASSDLPGESAISNLDDLKSQSISEPKSTPETSSKSAESQAEFDINSLQSQMIEKGIVNMTRVINEKADVENAMQLEDLGTVNFYWGTPGTLKNGRLVKGGGIFHLIEQRNLEGNDGVAMALRVPEILVKGKRGDIYGPKGGERININHDGHTVVLSRFRKGVPNNWVLTGWKDWDGDVGSAVNAQADYSNQNHGISNGRGAPSSGEIPSKSAESQAEFDNTQKYTSSRVEVPEGNPFDRQIENSNGRVLMQLPEIVELAKELLSGKYPKVLEGISANGYFQYGKNPHIALNAKIAEILTKQEYDKVRAEVLSEMSEPLGMTSAQLEMQMLENSSLKQAFEKKLAAQLSALRDEVSKEREPIQARKTLAHEIGHLVDWLPDKTMSKGNILGRIASLHNYTKSILETENGEISNSAIRDELKALTSWWRLGGVNIDKISDINYREYVSNPKELYADAFSVLINAPAELEKRAPAFYAAFEEFLHRKPEVAELYEDIQNLLKNGGDEMWAARDKKLSEMFSSPEAGGIKDVNKPTKTQVWDALTTRLFSDYQPIYRRVKNNIKRTLKANKESLGKGEYNLLKKRLWEDYDKTSDVLQTWKYRVSIHEAYIDELKNNVLDLVKSAGLNLEDLNKYMFFKHIVENRKDIFSSLGYTPKTASDGLERMRKALGDERFLALESARENWWRIRKDLVFPKLRESGVFSKELLDLIESREFYAPANILKQKQFWGNTIKSMIENDGGSGFGPKIYAQLGNLAEVRNPAESLMLKDISLIDFALKNKASRELVSVMRKTDPQMVEQAKSVFGRPKKIDSKSVGTIFYLQNGKQQGFYVPRDVALIMEADVDLPANVLARTLLAGNSFVKALFTQLSPGFWPVGLIRDIGSLHVRVPTQSVYNIRNVPIIGPISDFAGIIKNFPEAYRSVYGKRSKKGLEALKQGVLISHRESHGAGGASPETQRSAIMKALRDFHRDYGEAKTPSEYGRVYDAIRRGFNLLSKGFNYYAGLGQVFERAVKLHGLDLVEKNPKLSDAARRIIVRRHAGSPDFLDKGTLARYIDGAAMFFNPQVQAWKSLPDAFRRDKMSAWRYGWWLASAVVPTLAALGYLGKSIRDSYANMLGTSGDELEKQYRSIPLYDIVNYSPFSLGWYDKEQKKVEYIRIPLPDEVRIPRALILMATMGEDSGTKPLKYVGEQLPLGNPVLDTAKAWWQFAVNGENPRDFRGQEIVDRDSFVSGKGLEDMLKYSWNNLGGSMIHTFQDKQLGVPDKKGLEAFLSSPGISSTLGRFFKVSNRGIMDAARIAGEKYQREVAAPNRMMRNEFAQRLFDKEEITPDERSAYMNAFRSRAEVSAFNRKLKDAARSDDVIFRAASLNASSKAEARARLEALFKNGILDQREYELELSKLNR